MRDDNFSDLPDWNDDLDPDEEGESWKPNPTKEACKKLYLQWSSVMTMLNGCLKINNEEKAEDTWIDSIQSILLADAFQVAVKIRSSETGGIYVIRMENAGIIRKSAQSVQSSMLLLMGEGIVEKEYGDIIRNEIEIFKELFRQWVNTFEKDEFTDEWGLFV